MSVEVIAIGGYEEVGKNISAKPLKRFHPNSVEQISTERRAKL